MELNKVKEKFDILIKLNLNVALINKFEDNINELGWEIKS